MSLERTYKSIRNLENEEQITTSQLFDFMIGFAIEVFKHNGVKDISGMSMGERENLVYYAFDLSNMLLSVINENEDAILRQDDAAELQSIFSQIKELRSELAKKSKDVKRLKEKKARLQEERDKLRKENETLFSVRNECGELEDEIGMLNDPALKGIEEMRDSLRDELRRRQEKYSDLSSEIGELERQINDTNDQCNNAREELANKQSDFDKVIKEKESLEQSTQELEKNKKKCEEWIAGFRNCNSEMMKNIEEYNALYSQIYTAVNSIFNEEYIKEHLFSSEEKNGKPTADSYPDLSLFTDKIESADDLKDWLNTLQCRIKGLLEVYQDELGRLIECSSNIIADI